MVKIPDQLNHLYTLYWVYLVRWFIYYIYEILGKNMAQKLNITGKAGLLKSAIENKLR